MAAVIAAEVTAFDGLTGLRNVKSKLTELIRRGIPGHAHLFYGTAGMGKRSFAHAFAKALLCAEAPPQPDAAAGSSGPTPPPDADVAAGSSGPAPRLDAAAESSGPAPRLPCGACLPCKLFRDGALGDFLSVGPTGQGQRPVIPVDAVRNITGWFATRPLYTRRKVCIIENADHMTEQAQNALLKTLEEPPSYGAIILTAENPGMLLETVRSRCTMTHFTGYTDGEIEYILKNSPESMHIFSQELTQKHTKDNAQSNAPINALNNTTQTDSKKNIRTNSRGSIITLLARLSGGNPGYALEMARSETFFALRDELLNLFCGHLDGDARSTFLLASFLEKNRERFTQFSGIIIHWLLDIWRRSISGTRGAGSGAVNSAEELKIDGYCARFKPAALLDCIERVDETCSSLSANANFTLAVNSMLFKITDYLAES